MKKFTKGPWVIVPAEDEWGHGRIASIEEKPESMIGENYWSVAECNTMREEHDANAHLIARSPSMYEALDRILFRCNSFVDDERDMSQDSIAAIAMICTRELKKARGEE